MPKKAYIGLLAMLVTIVATGCGGAADGEWPSRPIELAVFSDPGGGTDLSNRALADAMEGELDADIRVSNMTGGRGGEATQYVDAEPDGHRWLGASETLLTSAVRGAHPTTTEDWRYFIFAGSPGVISVPEDSPYETFEELIVAVEEDPGSMTIAASGPGSIWHMRAEVLNQETDFDVRYTPYEGSSPSQVAALSGEVDMVHTALAEQVSDIRSGQLRPLVMVEPEPYELEDAGEIPAITESYPELEEHLPLPQWLGFMVPAETPEEVVEDITTAFDEALDSESVEEFLEDTNNELYGMSGDEAQEMAEDLESQLSWLLYDLDIAEESPEEYGIPRP